MRIMFKSILVGVLLVFAVATCAFAAPGAVEIFDSADAEFAAESIENTVDLMASNSGTCGNALTWTLGTDGTLTIKGTGDMIDWSKVESTPWYSSISNIKSIVIEEGVTSVGNNAFDIEDAGDIEVDYDDLFYTVLASGKTSNVAWEVGDNGCLYLSGTGATPNYASEQAVPWKEYKDSITRVSIKSGITGIGNYTFYGLAKLSEIVLPETVTSVGAYAFADCSGLTQVYLANVSAVFENAFDNCSSLESVKFGGYDSYLAVKESLDASVSCDYCIGDYKKVIDITLPKTLVDIGLDAFKRFFGVVEGYAGSYAEQYCASAGFVFVPYSMEIDLGEKAASSNVRYYEINGKQCKIESDSNILKIIPSGNMLVEVVEKASEDSVSVVSTKYYHVDGDNLTYSEVSGLASHMDNDGDATIRISSPLATRFKAKLSTYAKYEEDEFVIDEYGFILAREDKLKEADAELNFDFASIATGVAYNKADETDIVFDSSDDEWCVFTGILMNIPKKHYATNIVCKTYTKLTIDGESFIVYGEAVSASLYSVAKSLVDSTSISKEQRSALEKIISVVEINELPIPGDDLFS